MNFKFLRCRNLMYIRVYIIIAEPKYLLFTRERLVGDDNFGYESIFLHTLAIYSYTIMKKVEERHNNEKKN